MIWEVREDRQYTTRVHIDDVDVSDKLTDLKINFDLSGSSSSSIFGSVLVYNLDLEFIENIKGDTLRVEFGYYIGEYMDEPTYDYKDFGYFKITESAYDEKSDSTKITAQTNLDALNEKFSLQDLSDNPVENLIPNGWDSFTPVGGAEITITHLDNGLVNVKSTGGSSPVKMRFGIGKSLDKNVIFTTQMVNNSNQIMYVRDVPEYNTVQIQGGEYQSINIKSEKNDSESHNSWEIRAYDVDSNLDFTSSESMMYDLEGVNTTNSIITQSLKDNESVVLPSVDLPLGTIGDKFYDRRLELFKDIASLTRTYLEVHYDKTNIKYVFKEIDEPNVLLPVFELEHEDVLPPIDTVDLRYSYGDNVAMGNGETTLALNDIELIRDQKEDVLPFLYGLYKGFTYTQLKFTSPSHMFIGNQVTLNSIDGPVVALITKGDFDGVQWVGTYESEIIDQEEVHTNYVGTYDRVLKDTSIKVDKVEGSIDIIVAEQQEIGDEISRQSGEIALLKDGLTVEIAERVNQGDQIIDYVGTMLDVSLDGIRIEVENTKTQVEDLEGNLRDMQIYFDFRDDGLGLGRRDSPYKAQIDNESLSFTENGNVNTEISRQRLLTNRVEVKESLIIANTKIELSPYDSSRVIWRVV